MTFRAAVVQDSPVLFNLQSTIEKVEVISEKASKNNAKLIVFLKLFWIFLVLDKVREADSFNVSSVRLKHNSWCRLCRKNNKLTTKRVTITSM